MSIVITDRMMSAPKGFRSGLKDETEKLAKRRVQPAPREVAIRSGRLAPASILARLGFEKALSRFFKSMRRRAVKVLAAWLGFEHAHIEKASRQDKTLQEILSALADDWEAIAASAEEFITVAATAGAELGGLRLEISSEGMLTAINETARDWAKDRAAELVGMRRLRDGSLVENPSARWAITDTTRDKLRAVIKELFEAPKLSLREVEAAIEDAGIFSDTRATMIARTEISRAQSQGNLAAWRTSGLVKQVNWQLSEMHDKVDECDDAESESPYDIDEVPELPLHPNCECALVLIENPDRDKLQKYSDDQERVPAWPPGGGQFAGGGGAEDKSKAFFGMPNGLHTRECGERLVSHLEKKTSGTKFELIGSVAKEGQSWHGLDVKVLPGDKFDFSELKSSMSKEGLNYVGNQLVSPKEAESYGKPVARGVWSEIQSFKDFDTRHKVEFWFVDKKETK